MSAQAAGGDASHPCRELVWQYGRAKLQRLGAMLGPVQFSAPGRENFSPLHVAPWADEPGAWQLPGILRRLRGEWPCVPFGRTDRPSALSSTWASREPGDHWPHGFASNHVWQWLPDDDPLVLSLAIEPPPGSLKRMVRSVRAWPDEATLELSLSIEVSESCVLPVALHPTLRIDGRAVRLELPRHGVGVTYPVDAEAGISRLAADQHFSRLEEVPCADGTVLDLTRFPLSVDTEELLQVRDLEGPIELHDLHAGWALQLDWDRRLLPDVMLWVSHRGRSQPPWNGRHVALGVEPVNGLFDLGRVASAPAGHALADRRGIALEPGAPLVLRYRLSAWPEMPA